MPSLKCLVLDQIWTSCSSSLFGILYQGSWHFLSLWPWRYRKRWLTAKWETDAMRHCAILFFCGGCIDPVNMSFLSLIWRKQKQSFNEWYGVCGCNFEITVTPNFKKYLELIETQVAIAVIELKQLPPEAILENVDWSLPCLKFGFHPHTSKKRRCHAVLQQ